MTIFSNSGGGVKFCLHKIVHRQVFSQTRDVGSFRGCILNPAAQDLFPFVEGNFSVTCWSV